MALERTLELRHRDSAHLKVSPSLLDPWKEHLPVSFSLQDTVLLVCTQTLQGLCLPFLVPTKRATSPRTKDMVALAEGPSQCSQTRQGAASHLRNNASPGKGTLCAHQTGPVLLQSSLSVSELPPACLRGLGPPRDVPVPVPGAPCSHLLL
jgi:hypothetical protein